MTEPAHHVARVIWAGLVHHNTYINAFMCGCGVYIMQNHLGAGKIPYYIAKLLSGFQLKTNSSDSKLFNVQWSSLRTPTDHLSIK